jgi:hypothetical protein
MIRGIRGTMKHIRSGSFQPSPHPGWQQRFDEESYPFELSASDTKRNSSQLLIWTLVLKTE